MILIYLNIYIYEDTNTNVNTVYGETDNLNITICRSTLGYGFEHISNLFINYTENTALDIDVLCL